MKLTEKTRWKKERVEFDPLEKLNRWVDKGCFFSMTAFNKLGINPQSEYNTPSGIYSYPLNGEFLERLLTNSLPFVGEQPFVQIFRPKSPSAVLMLDFGQEKYNELIDEIYRKLPELNLGMTRDEAVLLIKKAESSTQRIPGKFWRATRLLSNKNPVKWRQLFLNLGIHGCYDVGFGIIHSNERKQAVFFGVNLLEHLDALDNPVLIKLEMYEKFLKHANKGNTEWLIKNINRIAEFGIHGLSSLIEQLSPKTILEMLARENFITDIDLFIEYASSYILNAHGDNPVREFVNTMVECGKKSYLISFIRSLEQKVKVRYYEDKLTEKLVNDISVMKEELQ